MTRFVTADGRRGACSLVLVSLLAAACSSWNTGTSNDQSAENACLDICEALARAGERCGLEYKRVYDQMLRDVANGDCKNVSGIRDEAELRDACIPALAKEACTKVVAGEHDASCSKQLQRTASFTPSLTP
jgi:hypothetical protein